MAIKKKPPIATPEDFEGLTLMRMRTEYIKRVRIIDLTFTEPLTLIGGDNSNGKTSYLDSMDWCLGGKSVIQMDPIHHGRQTGSMLCEFGDGKNVALAVTRTLKRVGDDEFTADVEVDIPGHIAPTRIQEFLDKLAGRISFDPMAFDRLKDAERFEALRKLVSGFDFTKNAGDRKMIFDKRTEVNRDLTREQSAADATVVSAEAPCELIDESALTQELEDAGRKNSERATRQANRLKAVEWVDQARASIANLDQDILHCVEQSELIRDTSIAQYQQQIDALQKAIENSRSLCKETIERESAKLRAQAADITHKIADTEERLTAAGDLPPETDTAAISIKLAQARVTNAQYATWKQLGERKAEHHKKADEHAQEWERLSKQIGDLDAARQKAISDAKLPIEGLGFGDDFITLNKVPWSQAGRAERVDASTAIAMALHPKLKVILIRDGSDLGKAMRDRIRARAETLGYRVLMEVIDDSPNTHVVIENGEVKARTEVEVV